jgi:hypothetical protein
MSKKLKKERALEDMSSQDLIEALIYDEYVQDNVHACNDYALDKHGNSLISIGYESPADRGKKKAASLILFSFDIEGRLVGIETAVRPEGKSDWCVSVSEKFVDFTPRFHSDPPKKGKKKRGDF